MKRCLPSLVCLCLSLVACANDEREPASSPSYPLSRDDPAAWLALDPADFPRAKRPIFAATGEANARANDALSYALDTGTVVHTPSAPVVATKLGTQRTAGFGGTLPDTIGDGSPLGSHKQAIVLGSDTRTRIEDTTQWPARAHALVLITFPGGSASCSGTLVGPRSLVTAGHCVFDPALGGWATAATVVPGADDRYTPFGSAKATMVYSVSGWVNGQTAGYDYGMINLDRAIGAITGWYGLANLPTSYTAGMPTRVSGYPGDKDNGWRQYTGTGWVTTAGLSLRHNVDTAGGESGAAMIAPYSGNEYVFGVHVGDGYTSHDGSFNRGVSWDLERFDLLNTWIAAAATLPLANADFSQWEDLGGQAWSGPASVYRGDGALDLFVRGTDRAAYHKTWTGHAWSPSPADWTDQGADTIGNLAVVSKAFNQVDVFARGRDNRLYTKSAFDNVWPAFWKDLGGEIAGPPSVVSVNALRLDVFARNFKGEVLHYAKNRNIWAAPKNLGGGITGTVACVSGSPGRIDLIARGNDSNLWTKYHDGARWWPSQLGWTMLPATQVMDSPTAVSWGKNRIDAFSVTWTGAVVQWAWDGGTWSGPYLLGGNVPNGGVRAVARTANRLDLVVRGSNGAVFWKQWNGAAWFPSTTAWQSLSGDMAEVDIMAMNSTRLDVFARGSNLRVYHTYWDGSAWHH